MPCLSDYMEPSDYQMRIARTIKNLIYVKRKLDLTVSKDLIKESKEIYFTREEGDVFVAELCGLLSNLSKRKLDAIVYNAKDPKSRELADWWEEHQKADKARTSAERKAKAEAKKKASILAKLTPSERKLLKV